MGSINLAYIVPKLAMGHIGIKWRTLNVIYRWKAYHIGFQKIYVGGLKVLLVKIIALVHRASVFSKLIF